MIAAVRAGMTAAVVAAIAAGLEPEAVPIDEPATAVATAVLPPDHPWPGTPGPDEAALLDALNQREERQAKLDRHRAALRRWQEQQARRMPCATAAAAAYREMRLAAKRRSRALGHGSG